MPSIFIAEEYMGKRRLKIWEEGRIVYYCNEADANFWDDHWDNLITKDYYRKYEEGGLDEYSDFFEKYLRKEDKILEAGCGTAQYVVALRSRGFKRIEGIDWGDQTIRRVKAIYPNLPVKIGDATKVDAGMNYYDGYISLGVVEHREEGPEPFLNEAHRILKPEGYAFISVPYINTLRKIKRRLGLFHKVNITNMAFYQYAYQKSEFQNILERTGFEVIETHGISGAFGIRDEFPDLFQILDRLPGSWRINRYLKKFDRLNNWGHMILFVCRKR
jgi:SAM-dependent methyltransferase